jgi:hypothetical protein
MGNIFEDLFAENQPEYVKNLLQEKNLRVRMCESCKKELFSNKKILSFHSFDQLVSLMTNDFFEYTDEECCQVANLFYRTLRFKRILPLFVDDEGLDLASRCLISLGFFYDALENRSVRYGAPKPEFYRKVGKKVILNMEMKDLHNNFNNWENYFRDNLSNKLLRE